MLKKIISLLLVVSLLFCFAACGDEKPADEETGENATYTQLVNKPDDWETNFKDYYVLDEDGNPVHLTGDTAPEFVANKYLAYGVVQKENAETNSSTDKNSNNKKGGSTSKVNATATKTTKFANDPYSDIPASVKGTTVEYLMCRSITDNDKKLVSDFEKKTGIKVNLVYAEFGTYGETVASRVAAGNAPDIINSERLAYPNGLISLCEPLDKYAFKLEDSFWDYDTMKYSKLRGKYYGVVSKSALYHDCRMMMYNVDLMKKILKSDYSKKSPRALWKANNWNFDTFKELADTIHDAGYTPLTYISQYDFALASGQDLVTFNGTKYSSNLSNKTLMKAWQFTHDLFAQTGYVEPYNQDNFISGKTVMFINTVYNCYNKNAFPKIKFEVDAVPVPGINGVTNAPADIRFYSLAKGAKNPIGSAYFLRYMLDYGNGFEKSEAINNNVWETAVYVSNKLPKTMECSSHLLKYVSDAAESQVRTYLLTEAQIATALKKCENQVTNAANRVNKSVLKVN